MGPLAHLLLALAVQAPAAQVSGVVREAGSDRPLGGAVVAVSDAGLVRETDPQGRYRLTGVPPGPQHITVQALGYHARTLHALVPRSGTVELDITLEPDPVRLDPLKIYTPPAVGTLEDGFAQALVDPHISMPAARNDPYVAEVDALLALRSGVVRTTPEAGEGVHLRGGASDQTAYLLNGIPILSPYHAGGIFGAFSPDALSSVEVRAVSAGGLPDNTLSGALLATTRAPSSHLAGRGQVSTTQVGLTVDGPIGSSGAGFLASARAGFPTFPPGRKDPTRLSGESGDRIGTITLPVGGGHFEAVYYGSENEMEPLASQPDSTGSPRPRNTFAWGSRSLGLEWRSTAGQPGVTMRAWRASQGADATWAAASTLPATLASERVDHGAALEALWSRPSGALGLGVRMERSRTAYRTTGGSAGDVDLDATTPVATLSLRMEQTLPAGLRLRAAAALARTDGAFYGAPSAELRWEPDSKLALGASVGRTIQFSQSLRNAESVVGRIFPPDLFLGGGHPDIPIARAEQVLLAADVRPRELLRLRVQAYRRTLHNLVLVAPFAGGPFLLGDPQQGGGRARGASLDVELGNARLGVLGGYSWQDVRYDYAGGSYTPEFATTHAVDGGIVVFPDPTLSLRLGVTSLLGRRSTLIATAFEWEACNVIDGCEFVGTPDYTGSPLGGVRLPSYVRIDAGVRKHWHRRLQGRDTRLGAYATVTNLLGRKNVLTYVRDPAGGLAGVDMRPLSPLVLGLEWWF
ncbi:MAG: TonB-dependent receptor [Gemmatimonadota bacterium]